MTKSESVVLINPNVIIQHSDLLTTGIPYMPVGLAYLAGTVREAGYAARVIDAFGEAPGSYRRTDEFLIRGLTPTEVVARLDGTQPLAVFLYAGTVASHRSLLDILAALKRASLDCPIVVFENPGAVYAYALTRLEADLRSAGADYVMIGEPEGGALELLAAISAGSPPPVGLLGRGAEPDIDALPYPAWDLLPLEKYWALGYSHGPVTGRFLPLVTSRGCPYDCAFCITPETAGRRWRGRRPEGVVDEMEHFSRECGVTEFHIEDLNPTVKEERIVGMCRELLSRGLKLRWKIAAGTKLETLSRLETLDLMAEAGCSYLSCSPETGSPRLLKLMGKPFRWDFALEQVAHMRRLGIRTQACFVLGFPGETEEDRAQTWSYVRRLVESGLDEIALFIVTPILGSRIFDDFESPDDLSRLSFSPAWRKDYAELCRFRKRLYRAFLWWKTLSAPSRVLRQCLNFMVRRFETKMEMTPYRALREFFESIGAPQERDDG